MGSLLWGLLTLFEGMGLTHEREVMVAETPESFADSVAKVCNNRELWQALSEKGLHRSRVALPLRSLRKRCGMLLAPWLDDWDLETVG